MKFLVCDSTLLEGGNLPIERLFIFDFSHGLADLMLEKYPKTVRASLSGEIEASPHLVNKMVENNESDLLIFEAKMNLKRV